MNEIQRLVAHVCGQETFDRDKAFEGLEKVIDYDWQKRFVDLLEDAVRARKEIDFRTP